eukprot:UN08735
MTLDGVPLTTATPATRIKEIQQVHKSRPDDVYIATFLKCGTTWLQQILTLMYDCPQGDRKTVVKDSPWLEYLTQEEIRWCVFTTSFQDTFEVAVDPKGRRRQIHLLLQKSA